MRALHRVLAISLFGTLAVSGNVARGWSTQDPAPAQSSGVQQEAPRRGAQGNGERRPGVFGKVTAIHEQSLEIASPAGETVTVNITASTEFRKDRDAAKFADFKVGDIVGVRGEENADHTWTAQSVRAVPAGAFLGGGPGPGGAPTGRGGPGGPRGPGGGGMRPAGVLGQDYVFGEVKAVDAPSLTILRPDNVTQTIVLNEETSLRKGRDSITMADIQVGEHVMVRGGMKDGSFQPQNVFVIGAEQWKRMQEMGVAGPPTANPPKENNPQPKPPEPRR